MNEFFTEAGIPCYVDERRMLGRSPLLKAVLAVLQLELENWPFRRLVSLLDSSCFQPRWKEYAYGSGARDVARVLRKLQLAGQRERILAGLKRGVTEAGPVAVGDQAPGGDTRFHRAVERAEALLLRLSDELQPLREPHLFSDWVSLVVSLGERLGMARFQPPPAHRTAIDLQQDQQAWEAFRETLYNAARAEAIWDRNPPPLSLSEFLSELTDLMQRQGIGHVAAEEGQVRVLQAAQVRNLDVPYLFVAGLTERGFPQQHSEGCLLDDNERRSLSGRGCGLHHRESRSAEEMLLFYSVVTRARRRLTLSYPAMNADGDPLSPSPYLLAVEDLFEPAGLQKSSEEQLDPLPPADRILGAADLRVRAMHEALDRQSGLFGALCQTPHLAATGLNIVAAVDAAVERFHLPEFSPHEGWLQNLGNRDSLQQRFSSEHEFSATQLEAYARCPFRFFLQYVLRVQPLETLELQADAGERGTLVHEILAELHRQLQTDEEPDLSDGLSGSLISRRFQELLREKLGQRPATSDVQEALITIEQRALDEWGTAYSQQWGEYIASLPDKLVLQPAMFEVPFGATQAAAEHATEPAAPPLVFGQGESAVRIGGRIDRIDAGLCEGRPVFIVVDYKTGKMVSLVECGIEDGTVLQLALYTLAVQRLQLLGHKAWPYQMGYWRLRVRGYFSGLKIWADDEGRLMEMDATIWEELQRQLEEIIPRLAAGIRSGQFPVFNSDLSCTTFCPYRTVCRVGQVRALPTQMMRIWKP
jgi:ATP-dependent helicase/DNAse subunit B